jgi:hypothetical protein
LRTELRRGNFFQINAEIAVERMEARQSQSEKMRQVGMNPAMDETTPFPSFGIGDGVNPSVCLRVESHGSFDGRSVEEGSSGELTSASRIATGDVNGHSK